MEEVLMSAPKLWLDVINFEVRMNENNVLFFRGVNYLNQNSQFKTNNQTQFNDRKFPEN